MTEDNVAYYDNTADITCPKCGSNNWKLFKYFYNESNLGFRVACANGCYVDNVNMIEKGDDSFDVIKTAFELIEDDRENTRHKIVTQKDIVEIIDPLNEDECRLNGLKEDNDLSDYGRGRLDKIEEGKEKLTRLIV